MESKRQNLMKKELAWLRRGAPARTAKPKFRIDAANELIANEPPVRDSVALSQMAMQRLGKDVVDLENVGALSDRRQAVLKDVTWRIAPASAPASSASMAPASRPFCHWSPVSSCRPAGGSSAARRSRSRPSLSNSFELEDIWDDRGSAKSSAPEEHLRDRRQGDDARPTARAASASRARSSRRR